jgi:aquaporin Z
VNAALREHWRHYAIEAWGLGMFMFVAGAMAALLGRFSFPPLEARVLFGAAMGTTVMALAYSPWGARSGAHMNPSLTIAYAWLRKLAPWDATFYIVAQFAGGFAGLACAALIFGAALTAPPTESIVTKPGAAGISAAFAAEAAMTFILMTVILYVSNARPQIARFTAVCSGILVATFITLEAPISGMSLNPARTFASSIVANDWTAAWLYLVAPPLGMLAAAFVYTRLHGSKAVKCGRLHHASKFHCIFRCGMSR